MYETAKEPSTTVVEMLHSYANPQFLVTDDQLAAIRDQRHDAKKAREIKAERKKKAVDKKRARIDV